MVKLTEEEIMKSEEKRLDFQSELFTRYGKKYIHDLIEDAIYPFDKDVNFSRLTEVKADSNNRKTIAYYELTTTHPDKNIQRKNNMFDGLKNYFKPQLFEAHFEIGKNGLYHYHIKIGSRKYLRNCEFVKPNATHMPSQRLTEIQDGYRYTFQKIKSLQAFDKYINKEPVNLTGWEDIA